MSDEAQDGPQIKPFRDLGPVSWLQPFKTPHSNIVLHAPPGQEEEVNDLDIELAFEDRSIHSVSAWDLTEDQRAMIAAGAHLSMAVGIHPIPPLSLQVEPPFCPGDSTMMVFVKSAGEFACPTCDPRFGGNGAVRPTEEDGNHAPEDDRDASRRALDEAHSDFSPEDGETGDEGAGEGDD